MKISTFYKIPEEITLTCGNCGLTHTYKGTWKCPNCKADLSKRRKDALELPSETCPHCNGELQILERCIRCQHLQAKE